MLNSENTIFKSLYTVIKIPKANIDRITVGISNSKYNFVEMSELVILKVSRHVYMVKPNKEYRVS